MSETMEDYSLGEIIAMAGGIDALLDKWIGARPFPWHPMGFELRSERREFRFWQIDKDVQADDCDEVWGSGAERNIARDRLFERYCRIFDADERDVFDHLPHDEFCDTAYWLGLSYWLKRQESFRCFDCRGRFPRAGAPEAHHKDYRHRGREYPNHLADLVVLCGPCHGGRHGKPRGAR